MPATTTLLLSLVSVPLTLLGAVPVVLTRPRCCVTAYGTTPLVVPLLLTAVVSRRRLTRCVGHDYRVTLVYRGPSGLLRSRQMRL